MDWLSRTSPRRASPARRAAVAGNKRKTGRAAERTPGSGNRTATSSRTREALGTGLAIGGKQYEIQVIDKDSQSNPQRSTQNTNELITGEAVDLMLTTSTPETVNAVCDACEAPGGIPTIVPWRRDTPARWQAGAGPGFKFTVHFCFGVEPFAGACTRQEGRCDVAQ